ncbi:MAG TPA: 2Fe-2S iron-sulfur cluster binding domain-containing protein [Stellaceae bacterium]|nr:2Fe-2S iron-sulfur cluster binding domain-containing protein [Stellaceae bacterium]
MQIEVKTKKGAIAYPAQPQEPLLYAALRAGVALPYECATGTCGTCKARRLSGVVINDWSEAPGRQFLKPERDEVLMCQTRALSDCAFEVPGNADLAVAPQPRPSFGEARIERIERLTADVAALHLSLARPIEFVAGQFAVLRAPQIAGFRAYSMVNYARPTTAIEFVIKRKPEGKFTDWLFSQAAPGDLLEWFGPVGKAVFDPHEQRTILAIAGGSGIASIVSILEAGCAVGHFDAFAASIFFGVRTNSDIFYLDRLNGFAAQFPERLKVTVVLSHDRPSEELRRRYPLIGFESGFPHEIAARDLAGDFAGRVAYLAGPPILVDVAIRMLVTQARLPARDIRYDKFS